MRLDRRLANLGYGSRREVQALLRAGRVHVDGRVVHEPASSAEGEIAIDGVALDAPLTLLVAVHKPTGYVCSHVDREGPRVYDFVPEQWLRRNPRPTTVGRLDKDSSGLVLITDQLALVHDLTAPRRHVEKRYEVVLDRPLGDDAARVSGVFGSGALELRGEDTPCLPAPLTVLDDGRVDVRLFEGRHRQLRRMFAAVGYEVLTLHRRAIGPYDLGDLEPGHWRLIT